MVRTIVNLKFNPVRPLKSKEEDYFHPTLIFKLEVVKYCRAVLVEKFTLKLLC